ncbi:hypothetical protein HYDPIDRAFT_138830 [Hydnomerulius pinastri MD-312]|uniref:Cytochrome b561 domain-containing protein n=1 Tax=Hydnomerulius pinastri MD-312 TaxID=994086 RepID=A0A0C9VS20_9AGAM|nr:hypothetical protein HYDPIDRAFT_138830 [Hydnomerulius pinastri MD-312]
MGSNAILPEGRKSDTTAKTAVLASIVIFVITTWILIFSNNPTSLGWFAFHPILQSSAIACFTYGILTLQPTSQPHTKAAGLQRHQFAMIGLGFPLILLGTLVMVYYKYSHNAAHFTSWHGTFGIIAVAWLFVQVLLGAGSVWFGGVAFGGGAKAKAVWKYHRLSGYIVFPLVLFTAHLAGAWSTFVTSNTTLLVRLLAYTIAPIVILGGIYTRIR